MAGEGVEVWRGGVAAWETDTVGHLNVGFYLAKAMAGLAGLAAELGMVQAFTPRAESTLLVREIHIRFHREALAGAALHMTAGVVGLDADEGRVLFLLWHDGGGLAASFQMRVAHVTAGEARPFPWSTRVRERADALALPLPPDAAPRSLVFGPTQSRASLAEAHRLDLTRIGLGALDPRDCDAFGRMRPETLMARLAENAGRLTSPTRPDETAQARGSVALEYRLAFFNYPGAGDRFELRSGAGPGGAKVRKLVHWFLDPDGGRAWGGAEVIVADLDLASRRVAAWDEAAVAAWNARVTPGLEL